MSFARSARLVRRTAALVLAAALLAALVPGMASAAGGGATVVRGIQHEYGSCGNGDGYEMEGALVGCWWIDTFEVHPHPTQAGMLAHGKEHFEGCLGAVCGTFTTTYTYTARFDGATELHGRCHHPITGGTGGFYGARGELSFTDVVSSEPFFYPYWGNIQLGRKVKSTAVQAVSTTARSTGSAGLSVDAPC